MTPDLEPRVELVDVKVTIRQAGGAYGKFACPFCGGRPPTDDTGEDLRMRRLPGTGDTDDTDPPLRPLSPRVRALQFTKSGFYDCKAGVGALKDRCHRYHRCPEDTTTADTTKEEEGHLAAWREWVRVNTAAAEREKKKARRRGRRRVER